MIVVRYIGLDSYTHHADDGCPHCDEHVGDIDYGPEWTVDVPSFRVEYNIEPIDIPIRHEDFVLLDREIMNVVRKQMLHRLDFMVLNGEFPK